MKKFLKGERGAIEGVDMATGIIIFAMASTLVINLYFAIYKNVQGIKEHEVAIGCITFMFELFENENFEAVDSTAKINSLIASNEALSKYYSKDKDTAVNKVTPGSSTYNKDLAFTFYIENVVNLGYTFPKLGEKIEVRVLYNDVTAQRSVLFKKVKMNET